MESLLINSIRYNRDTSSFEFEKKILASPTFLDLISDIHTLFLQLDYGWRCNTKLVKNNFDLPSPLLKPYWAILSPMFLITITVRPIIPNQIGFSLIWNIFESLMILKGILKPLWTVFWLFILLPPTWTLLLLWRGPFFIIFNPLSLRGPSWSTWFKNVSYALSEIEKIARKQTTYLKHIKEKLLPT